MLSNRVLMNHLVGQWDMANCMSMHIMHFVMALKWFHFNDEVAMLTVDVCRVERAGVGLKATTCLVPATAIKGIEIVPPVQFKLILVLIVDENLNIVVENIPGHVHGHEMCAP